MWQLHESRNKGAQNSPDAFIANVDDGITAFWIKLTASDDGSFEAKLIGLLNVVVQR